jgi:ankyrin repeat protein
MSPSSDLSLAIANLDWTRATALAKGVPAQAAIWTKRAGFFEGVKHARCLPLHEACVTTAPTATVQAILNANPTAARTKETSYSRLPLHCACRRANADPSVIRLLLGAHKAACLVPDELGRLPLHYALSNAADSAVIHLLLSAQPESARGVDAGGWTPLHVACAEGAPIGVIMALLHQYQEACIMRTDKGSTPAKCLSKTAANRQEIKDMLREARLQFDATFVNPLATRKTLLADNHDAVLV